MNIAQMLLLFQVQQLNASWQSQQGNEGLYDLGNSGTSGSQLFASLLQAAMGSETADLQGFNTLSQELTGSGGSPIQNYQSSTDLQSVNKSPSSLDNLINSMAQKYGVDSNLIKQVVKAESGFNSHAMSPAGAKGLMQLMPGTAAAYGVGNAYDPLQNLDGGTHLLKNLLDHYQGNIPLALAAYNAGSGAVDKYQGIPPYKETQNYVQKIMAGLNRRDWKV
ncbi:soluble lytic murein transglycosylase precursor [Desulfosporosinus acididurans]|uniref:Soluble lytic murein transglycosylase n=1 Tax=Desulfosporosinus acididurans TaxID=476652 RepID=A0A0J1IK28_9FIRM|nr:lytic transglycosylase domain-containing protein [Desulfosporosinus acididurans]KLU65026.1 soluble lytic murein transglycosylase precursor [Desulfosporosinus acididurans]